MMSAQVINGVLLPILLVFLVFIASDKHIMGRFKNSRLWNVLTWATIVLITVLTVGDVRPSGAGILARREPAARGTATSMASQSASDRGCMPSSGCPGCAGRP
ncbi:MAG: divalent metal cation transporter [Collinsella sp.]